MVGRAREAGLALVGGAEGQQRRLLERDRVVLLAGRAEPRQLAGHADHLQRALLDPGRLLGVERQDLVGELELGHDEGDQALGPELAHGGQAVVPVGGPVAPVRRAHHQHRVEIAVEPIEHRGQLLHVRLGEVALERGRVDRLEREGGQELPAPAQRVAVTREHLPAGGRDRGLELARLRRRAALLQLGRREPARAGLGGLAPAGARLLGRAAARLLLGGLLLGRLGLVLLRLGLLLLRHAPLSRSPARAAGS